ncbi:MAG TPA: LacI family DNA-binding transcriptional regulator [Acidobacteriaceae bacterium]|nr:LacI family DNA-binding transcriptional regulator [Acidobacteriaceae bacterium]
MNIREVAKRAGVSTATVSRVVNGTAPVDARTEKRVRAAIQRTGYYPNTHARTLGTGKSHIYGLIISDIENPFFPELVKCFERLAVERSYEVLIANTDYQPERMEGCVRRMLERKVDGVAIMTSEMDPHLIQTLSGRGIPIVFLDTGSVGPGISNISLDYDSGVDQAIDHLTSLGHRRIAFISGPDNLASARTRHEAFLASLRRKKLECSKELIRSANHRFDGGYAAMLEILKLPQRPTAVLASNDLTAIGIMGAVYEAGLRVPENISVVGFDDIALSSFMSPPLTTIRVSRADIAGCAFTSLYSASQLGKTMGVTHTVRAELVIRQSTAAVRAER